MESVGKLSVSFSHFLSRPLLLVIGNSHAGFPPQLLNPHISLPLSLLPLPSTFHYLHSPPPLPTHTHIFISLSCFPSLSRSFPLTLSSLITWPFKMTSRSGSSDPSEFSLCSCGNKVNLSSCDLRAGLYLSSTWTA